MCLMSYGFVATLSATPNLRVVLNVVVRVIWHLKKPFC